MSALPCGIAWSDQTAFPREAAELHFTGPLDRFIIRDQFLQKNTNILRQLPFITSSGTLPPLAGRASGAIHTKVHLYAFTGRAAVVLIPRP